MKPRIAAAVALIVALAITPAIGMSAAAAEPGALGAVTPTIKADTDSSSVELGMRFTSSTGGTVEGVRFFKDASNTGVHVGSLWTSRGERLASVTFANESASGWQEAKFATPVKISKLRTYVVSYLAPNGRYSADTEAFADSQTRGTLTVPSAGGVYAYGSGSFPTDTYKNSNYFVDVLYTSTTSTSAPTPSASPSPGSGVGTPVCVLASGENCDPVSPTEPTPTVPTPTVPTPTVPTPTVPGTTILNLPRIPWEGGPAYWKQFAKADAAGWDDPSFFPIGAWYNQIDTQQQVNYDKTVGINTYIQLWEGSDYKLMSNNGMFWIGGKLNSTFDENSPNWVGEMLDDEVDGRFTPEAGRAHLQSIVDGLRSGSGRFKYANYTKMVVDSDMSDSDAQRYVNDYTDVVSVDQYWYTIPQCSWTPYRDVYLAPVTQQNCRTASSYGKTMEGLRMRDEADGQLQPLWQFVENLNGGAAEVPSVLIKPGQVKGAVMNSIINEARGIVYFNQSLNGSCQSGAVIRQAQKTGAGYCGAAQVAAVAEVNAQVKKLAPVINTQSYEYDFGAGLDTMLKATDGSAYVFAMVDGASQPGSRTFTLPAGVAGKTVEVLNEGRSLSVNSDGTFVDSFANEYTYHVYKISLS